MSQNLPTKSAETALTLDSILDGITNSLDNGPTVSGPGENALYLRLRGLDDWVYGKENDPVTDDMAFVVNSGGYMHGLIAWHAGRPEFKAMVPVAEDLSTISTPEPNTLKAKNGLEYARSMTMRLDEDAEPTVFEYSANSRGGREAIENLMKATREQAATGSKAIYPLITLNSTSYMHPEHGQIVKPIFEIVDWLTQDEALALPDAEPEVEQVEAPEPEPETPRKRRKIASRG